MSAIGAVVLAAGEGARFGRPKALAETDGHPWVSIAVELLRSAQLAEIVVVIGAEADRVRSALPTGITVAENPDWSRGRTGSLHCGLRALPAAMRGALVHMVDFPEVRPGTVTALCSAFDRMACEAGTPPEVRIFLPVQDGRRGHPILLGRAVWPEVERLHADEPLRTVIRRDPTRVIEVAVDDPGIHANRNTSGEEG